MSISDKKNCTQQYDTKMRLGHYRKPTLNVRTLTLTLFGDENELIFRLSSQSVRAVPAVVSAGWCDSQDVCRLFRHG